MSDKLIIHGLEAECRIGILDWEQEKPQLIWIDLTLTIDAARASASDDVEEAVDYARLVATLTDYLKERRYNLLETVADEIATKILQEFAVPLVTVRVKKRSLPGIDYAAAEVTRRTRKGGTWRRIVRSPRASLQSQEGRVALHSRK